MKEVVGVNLWDPQFDEAVRVITTNGSVTKDGNCVMGRGVALEAKKRFRGLDGQLGTLIRDEGNHVFYFPLLRLATFPVKHYWWEKADLNLIRRSAGELVSRVYPRISRGVLIVLPRPGCGNGHLLWSIVKPKIEDILVQPEFLIVEKELI